MHSICFQCKFVDWQFTCASSPYLDIANLAFMNQSPEDTDANTTKFLTEYFQTFEFICQHLKIASPWESIEGFKALALRRGYVSMFVWLFVSYSPCVCTPKVMDRFVAIMKKAISLNPEFFD